MRILIVDDEKLILEEMEKILGEIMPGCDIAACSTERQAIEQAKENPFDVAFLDIELGVTNGIMLAKKLKDILPEIKIIFATSYPQYAVDAFAIHATGYLLKPVIKDDLKRELTFIYGENYFENRKLPAKNVQVQTFGGFEVRVNGEKLAFRRKKSAELLAYLVERRGYSVSTRQVCAVLFEDAPYDRKQKSYFHTVLAELKNTLHEAGAKDILVLERNSYAVDAAKIDCDYYRFLDGDVKTINTYQGEFLPQYSWAEFSAAELDRRR